MFKSKKGFTLVELLAVIVILAIILAIAVPGISGVISNSKKAAFESDVKMIITGIEYKVTQKSIDSSITLPADAANITATLSTYGGISSNYTSFVVNTTSPTVTVTAVSSGSGKFDVHHASGSRSALTVTD